MNVENLKPHQRRMIEEQNQLTERMAKLAEFLARPKVELDATERALLCEQLSGMAAYAAALEKRIARF